MDNSFLDFSTADVHQSTGGPIPANTLCWGIVTFSDNAPRDPQGNYLPTPSKSTEGNYYLDLVITIQGGRHDKRKIFEKLGVKGNKGWVDRGRTAMRAMLETHFGASMASQESAAKYQIPHLGVFHGARVAIKTGIENDTNQSGEPRQRSKVSNWLSPNPDSNMKKDWEKLQAGDCYPAQQEAPAQQSAGFAPPAAGGFSPPAQQTGFSPAAGFETPPPQPQQQGGFQPAANNSASPAGGFQPAAGGGAAPETPAAPAPGAAPAWMTGGQ